MIRIVTTTMTATLGICLVTVMMVRAQSPSTCDISGSWQHRTNDIGGSIWTFTAAEGPRYQATERGLSNGTGTATLEGNLVRLEWSSGWGYAGFFEWRLDPSCKRGEGRAVGTRLLIGTRPSRIERIPDNPDVTQPAPVPATESTLPPIPSLPVPDSTPAPVHATPAPPNNPPPVAEQKPATGGEPPPCPEPLSCGYCLGSGIRERWLALGGEAGRLGCPASNEGLAGRSPMGTIGPVAEFRGGTGGWLICHGSGARIHQIFVVEGCFHTTYRTLGGSASWLGFPISEAYEVKSGLRQDFEGGHILQYSTGACLAMAGHPPP